MDRRLLFIALALGAVAFILTLAFLRTVGSRTGEILIPTKSVVVAKQEIPAGQKVTLSMVEARAIPDTAVVQGAFTSVEKVVNQTVRYPIGRGEQISEVRLVESASVRALSFQLQPGQRGFTIPVNVTQSPASLLVPGDFVDVLATFDLVTIGLQPPTTEAAGRERDPRASVTLLQNVQVVSVQRNTAEGGVPYDPAVRGNPSKDGAISYLTLAVTPEQVQLLTLVLDKAKTITVSLRPFGDSDVRGLSPMAEPIPLDQILQPTSAPPRSNSGS